ncbi:esterase-like activity of phytase family protein [Aquimarina sp. RZ0]|uniref:esterase-like activity of phytase family protein n=1 Tax=Aquimarina sp. RZ0 TaxID=2607730 RepID=UPI0011F13A26|nr:esterase-like activity of phytase family protein [Aquimarina sp. RZ0]KAA1247042.1 esterase-like activity of phytase family protein [Aquimarina sp. RZ0]
MKNNILISIIFLCISCKSSSQNIHKDSFKIQYLDEFVIYNDSIFKDTKIGGLSGIEYNTQNDTYYIISDDAKMPRFYTASISIEKHKFTSVTIDQLTSIKDKKNKFFDTNIADLEAIRILNTDQLIFASEGSIKHNYEPAIFTTDKRGNFINNFKLPPYFLINSDSNNKPRHNGIFEGLVNDISNKGYWAAMELPLELDGEEPTVYNSGAPVRITHFDINTNQADFQFTYPLDKLAKDPKEKFGVNGVTAMLQLTKNQFLIVERGYAAGYGTQGNTVRIYLTNAQDVTNTLDFESIKDKKYQSATKQLLFDFESIRNQLTDQIVDNIEGITFGPILANGNQSLILVADNNFNPATVQINQLILLELIKTKQ